MPPSVEASSRRLAGHSGTIQHLQAECGDVSAVATAGYYLPALIEFSLAARIQPLT